MARARAKLRRERADARRAELVALEMEGQVIREESLRQALGRYVAAFRRIVSQAPGWVDAEGLTPDQAEVCRKIITRVCENLTASVATELGSMMVDRSTSKPQNTEED